MSLLERQRRFREVAKKIRSRPDPRKITAERSTNCRWSSMEWLGQVAWGLRGVR